MLYQRYFLRMNQSNTTHILGLLLALVLSLAAVHIILIPMESTSAHNRAVQRNRYNDVVKGNHSNGNHSNNSNGNLKTTGHTNNATTENNSSNFSSNHYFTRFNYNYKTDSETGKYRIIYTKPKYKAFHSQGNKIVVIFNKL